MVFSVDTDLILVSQYESKKGTAIFPGAWTTRASVPSRPSLWPKGNIWVRPLPQHRNRYALRVNKAAYRVAPHGLPLML